MRWRQKRRDREYAARIVARLQSGGPFVVKPVCAIGECSLCDASRLAGEQASCPS